MRLLALLLLAATAIAGFMAGRLSAPALLWIESQGTAINLGHTPDEIVCFDMSMIRPQCGQKDACVSFSDDGGVSVSNFNIRNYDDIEIICYDNPPANEI